MGGGGNNSSSSAARSALADAAAGVAGSLTSMLAFYPVDVYKTNLQAGKKTSNLSDAPAPGETREIDRKDKLSTATYAMRILIASFRGVHYKTAHTVASSFAYFFIYSWITSRHRTYVMSGGAKKYRPSTTARLLLAAVAAMMNTTLTLPLDVLSARRQTGTDSSDGNSDLNADDSTISVKRNMAEEQKVETEGASQNAEVSWDHNLRAVMDRAWEEADAPPPRAKIVRIASENTTGTSGYETADEECNDDECSGASCYAEKKGEDDLDSRGQSDTEDILSSASSIPPRILAESTSKRGLNLKSLSSLWSGLFPSLLLCSNPSIHYTVFDILKSSVLQRKAADRRSRSGANGGEDRLSMGESFFIGILAKFAATIVTYPLIRAKIMLMCKDKDKLRSTEKEEAASESNDRIKFRRGDTVLNFGGRVCPDGTSTNDSFGENRSDGAAQSLLGVLRSIYQDEGIPGLYRGCNLQLIHTVLKSALLMMVRERITYTTRRLLLSNKKLTT